MSGLRIGFARALLAVGVVGVARQASAGGESLALSPGQTVVVEACSPGEASTVSVRSLDGTGGPWSAPLTRPRVRDVRGASPARGVGFLVPQLSRGNYEVTCGGKSSRLAVAPRLRVPEARVFGAAGAEAIVSVGFVGPAALALVGGPPRAVRVSVTLATTSGSSSVLELPSTLTGADGLARFRVRVGEGTSELMASAPGFEPVKIVVTAGARPRTTESRLRAGDILLFVGGSASVPPAILDADRRDLPADAAGHPWYTHAAIYVGHDHGLPMVAEVLATGLRVAPLSLSTADAYAVDVYRRRELPEDAGSALAKLTQEYDGLDRLPVEQLEALAVSDGARADSLALAERTAGGKRAMTSAELVLWAYADAHAPLETPSRGPTWDALLTTDARRYDAVTPSGLARSPSLAFAFKLH